MAPDFWCHGPGSFLNNFFLVSPLCFLFKRWLDYATYRSYRNFASTQYDWFLQKRFPTMVGLMRMHCTPWFPLSLIIFSPFSGPSAKPPSSKSVMSQIYSPTPIRSLLAIPFPQTHLQEQTDWWDDQWPLTPPFLNSNFLSAPTPNSGRTKNPWRRLTQKQSWESKGYPHQCHPPPWK